MPAFTNAVFNIALALSLAPGASAAGVQEKLSQNDVCFKGVSDIKFDMTDHAIGDQYDWGGLENAVDNGNCLTVWADRNGARVPAQFFEDGLSSSNMIGDQAPVALEPEDLNFAVIVTLSMTVGATVFTCQGIRLGQGHGGDPFGYNNWWIAGENCSANGIDYRLACSCDNGTIMYFYNYGDVSNFFDVQV